MDDHEDDCADDCADDECVDRHRDAMHSGHQYYWAHFQTQRHAVDGGNVVGDDDDDHHCDLARANVHHGNPGEEVGARMEAVDAVVEHQQKVDGSLLTAALLLRDVAHFVDHQADDAAKVHPHCRSDSDDLRKPRESS